MFQTINTINEQVRRLLRHIWEANLNKNQSENDTIKHVALTKNFFQYPIKVLFNKTFLSISFSGVKIFLTSDNPKIFPNNIPVTMPNWFNVPKEPLSLTGAISDRYIGATEELIPRMKTKMQLNNNWSLKES